MANANVSADPIEQFFSQLPEYTPLLLHVSGSLRWEITDDNGGTETWYIEVDKGQLVASHKTGPADASLHTNREVAAQLVMGNLNTLSAMMRGMMRIEGNLGLLNQFQRLFPGPPASRGALGEGASQ